MVPLSTIRDDLSFLRLYCFAFVDVKRHVPIVERFDARRSTDLSGLLWLRHCMQAETTVRVIVHCSVEVASGTDVAGEARATVVRSHIFPSPPANQCTHWTDIAGGQANV